MWRGGEPLKTLLSASWPWTLLWAAQGCAAPSTAVLDDARPADIETAIRKVLAAYSSTRESEGVFRTGWEEKPLASAGRDLPAGARWIRVRYEVSLQGTAVHVRARAEVFVHHGAHRKTWDWLDARPFETQLLNQIVETARPITPWESRFWTRRVSASAASFFDLVASPRSSAAKANLGSSFRGPLDSYPLEQRLRAAFHADSPIRGQHAERDQRSRSRVKGRPRRSFAPHSRARRSCFQSASARRRMTAAA